ncbi:MAG: hypothetical protein A2V90_05190 [Gammaproteobacteria bacterium RBG_16_57_12]|nr:MAG: hypothetical protein A2V90_05190 [Gammaproteobacteria bacterium RBG_16_57_12]
MKRFVILFVILVAVFLGLGFAVLNAGLVTLNYYFGRGEYPLSLILVATLALGCFMGMLAGLGMYLGARRELARLRKEVKLKEKEVLNLRTLPLKDTH